MDQSNGTLSGRATDQRIRRSRRRDVGVHEAANPTSFSAFSTVSLSFLSFDVPNPWIVTCLLPDNAALSTLALIVHQSDLGSIFLAAVRRVLPRSGGVSPDDDVEDDDADERKDMDGPGRIRRHGDVANKMPTRMTRPICRPLRSAANDDGPGVARRRMGGLVAYAVEARHHGLCLCQPTVATCGHPRTDNRRFSCFSAAAAQL